MSEQSPEATESATPAETEASAEPETFTREYVENLRKENAKYRTKANENSEAAKAAEKARIDSMTESERAVVEAEARGRSAAATEYGTRLARTEFDAAAGRRNPAYDSASALEYVDLTKFLGEDGEPDSGAISAAVERLVPEQSGGSPSFDGGTRTTAPAQPGMSQLIRKAAGRA